MGAKNSLRVPDSVCHRACERQLPDGPSLDHNPWSERGQSPRTGLSARSHRDI